MSMGLCMFMAVIVMSQKSYVLFDSTVRSCREVSIIRQSSVLNKLHLSALKSGITTLKFFCEGPKRLVWKCIGYFSAKSAMLGKCPES